MKTHGKLTKKQRLAVLKRMRELLAHPRGFSRATLYNVRRPKKMGTHNPIRVLRRGDKIEPGDFGFCMLGAAEVAMREVAPDWFETDYEDGYALAASQYSSDGKQTKAVVDQLSILTLVKAKGFSSIPSFNDDDRTKKQDVLDILDARIAAHEA